MTTDNSTQEERITSAVTQARRAYQKAYYQANKEKAKEYQRQYNLTHKKRTKRWKGIGLKSIGREVTRQTFTASDILHSAPEKAARIIDKVLKGERGLIV